MAWSQYPPVRLCCVLALALAIYAVARADDDDCVVVLRSGGILRGAVSVSGERYVVTRPNSVVDVPATQVQLVAHSLFDAYRQQREQLPRDTAEAHLALAEWCLRYDLTEPAKTELADARRIDPRDPRTALLERRLAVVSVLKQPPAAGEPAKPHDDNPSKEELQRLIAMARELPPGVVERFTRKVQPLLVNSCTAAGCHQVGGKQNFQLDRAVLHGLANRRITLRNLMATLELVDKSSPRDSELVEIPRRVHGGLDHPVFGPRQDAQLEQLVDWADLVAGLSEGELPHAKPAAIAASTRSTKPAEATSDLDLPPSRFLDRSIATANFDDAKQDPLPKSRLKFGADIKSWQPKDEFDPEIFNRFAAKAAEQGPATATGPPAIRSAAVDQK